MRLNQGFKILGFRREKFCLPSNAMYPLWNINTNFGDSNSFEFVVCASYIFVPYVFIILLWLHVIAAVGSVFMDLWIHLSLMPMKGACIDMKANP